MTKILIDTNVILDFSLNRQPFSIDAAKIFTLAEQNKINAFINTLTLANCYYLMRKDFPHKVVIAQLEAITQFVDVLDLTRNNALKALKSNFSDFEDAMQNETALSSKIDIIVTRNTKDFKKSPLQIMKPDVFIRLVESQL